MQYSKSAVICSLLTSLKARNVYVKGVLFCRHQKARKWLFSIHIEPVRWPSSVYKIKVSIELTLEEWKAGTVKMYPIFYCNWTNFLNAAKSGYVLSSTLYLQKSSSKLNKLWEYSFVILWRCVSIIQFNSVFLNWI